MGTFFSFSKLFQVAFVGLSLIAVYPATAELYIGRSIVNSGPRVATPGTMHNVAFAGRIKSEESCPVLAKELNSFYLDSELFENYFTYDYMIACVPYDSTEVNIIVDLTIEAKSQDFESILQKYIKAKKDNDWRGIYLQLQQIDFIQTRVSGAVHLLEGSSKPTWSFEIPGPFNQRYSSFDSYLSSIHSYAKNFFQSENMSVVYGYIQELFGPQDYVLFRSYLAKGNYLTMSIPRTMRTSSGKVYAGAYTDGVFRDCRSQDKSGTCAP